MEAQVVGEGRDDGNVSQGSVRWWGGWAWAALKARLMGLLA